MAQGFKAGDSHVGDVCYICDDPIRKDDEVRYYGGPFVMHASCIDTLIREA